MYILAAAAAGGAAAAANFPTPEEKQEADARSVHVGNVDYSSTAKEVGQHFQGCGAVSRVTIMCDKFSGNPKGLVTMDQFVCVFFYFYCLNANLVY